MKSDMENRVYIEDYYLDYLVFGGITTLKSFFEHIVSYTELNRVDEQESKYLLTEMVCDLFNIDFDVDFKYRKNLIEQIKSKTDYPIIKEDMKKELMRIYKNTQSYLESEFGGNSIRLYRGLNPVERNCFYDDESNFKSNIITSFTTDKRRYTKEVQVAVDVPIENILFWENLCPSTDEGSFLCTGLSLEREVIVINGEGKFDIAEVVFQNDNIKRMREAEEKFW
ncbi:hypothetical protein AALK46_12680 [Staphylococcus nepalensis]|uniref:hypothetical protein n=2 Tax=Staphylococcus nepalensis TaxID=214473 RepID=UPI0035187B5C